MNFDWTKRNHEKGFYCITEHHEQNGIVEEFDWGFYKRSMETYIEAVDEILDKYPNAKYDPLTDNWYLREGTDYFIIWNADIYSGPHGETYEMFEDLEDDDYTDMWYDYEDEDL